jgi:hypothetical protein
VPKDVRVAWSLRPPGDLDAALNKRYSASRVEPEAAFRLAEPVAGAPVENVEAKPRNVNSSPPEPSSPLLRQPRNSPPAVNVGDPRPPRVRSPFNFDDLEEPACEPAPGEELCQTDVAANAGRC